MDVGVVLKASEVVAPVNRVVIVMLVGESAGAVVKKKM